MTIFHETTHLSEIIENSENMPVIIFKYSNNCGSSVRLENELNKAFGAGKIVSKIYRVTVQNQPVLSKKIEDWFAIKHESPQIIAIDRGKVIYTANHNKISLDDLQ